MQDDETFDGRVQRVGQGLKNLAQRVNLVRQTLRGRGQMVRELAIKPAVDEWQKSRPRPIGLGILRGPPQPEEAQKVEIKQAEVEPKPVEPKPILPGLWDLITTKPKVEAPQAEPQEPVEKPAERRYPPERPALY